MTTTEVTRWAEKLDEMTANEIAALFRAEGVTGIPGSTRRCPVANFLKSRAQVVGICVGGGWIDWMEIVPGDDNVPRTVSGQFLSKSSTGGIREFVERFDNGGFPYLRGLSAYPSNVALGDILKSPSFALAPV